MKHNQYFNIFKKTLNSDSGELLMTLKIQYEKNIWQKLIKSPYLNNNFYAEMSHNDPYGAIYHLNIKDYIKDLFPNVYDTIKESALRNIRINLDDDIFIVCLATMADYRKVNEQFDNEMAFLEYMNSEISEMDKHRNITEEILKEAGFVYLEKESSLFREAHKLDPELGKSDYKEFRLWTNDKFPLKLDIDNGYNNRGTNWHLHIDNNSCETIGSADIDNVWEFNTLMQVFKSKFRL